MALPKGKAIEQRCTSFVTSRPPSSNSRLLDRFALLVFPVIFAICLPVKSFALNPRTPLSQYAHTSWRLQDGFLSSPPTSITQTRDGYLWIGTRTGLFRFDGVRFIPFRQITQGPPLRGAVYGLFGSSDGSLWISTSYGIYQWHNHKLMQYGFTGGLATVFAQDSAGTLWAGRIRVHGAGGGACRLEGRAFNCIGGELGNSFLYIDAIAPSGDGSVWLQGVDSIFHYQAGKITAFPFPLLKSDQDLETSHGLSVDPKGGLWVGWPYAGPGKGLTHFAHGRFHSVRLPGLDGSQIQTEATFVDRSGALWVATVADGLLRISDGRVEHYRSSDGLSSNQCFRVFEDSEGSIWVITSKGVDRFSDLSVLTYTTAEHLTNNALGSVLAARDGSVWITSSDGVDILKNGSVSRLKDEVHVPGHEATSIMQARNGDIWIGFDNSLYRLHDGRFTEIRREDGKPVGLVGYLAEDRENTVWVSIFSASPVAQRLLTVKSGSTVARTFHTNLGIATVLIPDRQSGMWVLDRRGVLAHIQDGSVHLVPDTLFRGKTQQSAIQGPDGTVYVCCDEGILLIRGDTVRFVPDERFGSCRISGLLFDQAGNLWAAGLCGLYRVSKEQLQRWWDAPQDTRRDWLFFDASDGYSGSWTDFSKPVSMSPDGRLWFATATGLRMVDPNHLALNTAIPPVHIESVTANHVRTPAPGPYILPPLIREIEFDYTALSFINPQKVKFRYRLDGYDTAWQDADTRRQAFYTNLPSGRYTFHVIACNNSGVWNYKGDSVSVTIPPAWYQALWFRISLVVLLCLSLWAMYLLRLRRLEREMSLQLRSQVSERMRIARELHDTLLQAVQGLVLSFSNFANVATAADSDRADAERALDRADELLIAGRDRIKELRSYGEDQNDLSDDVRAVASELLATSGLGLTIEVDGEIQTLTAIVHDEALWIVREAVSNTLKHAAANQIRINLCFLWRGFRLMIADDGRGFDDATLKARQTHHFGVTGMAERARSVGGRLVMRSEPGHGTEICLSVPGVLAYREKRRWWNWLAGALH